MRARYGANLAKALEAVLWPAGKSQDTDFHKLLKLVFYAGRKHLNRHGRPIVGGRYHADDLGPVCVPVYDLLRGDPLTLMMVERNGRLPFDVVDGFRLGPHRSANLRLLSASDVEAMEAAHREHGYLDLRELIELSREDPAYRNADGGDMAYEDFLDEGPEKGRRACDLAEVSRYAAV